MTDWAAIIQASQRLYASVADGIDLEPALGSVVAAVGGDHAILWAGASEADARVTTVGADERDLARSFAAFAEHDPGVLAPSRWPIGAPTTRSALVSDRDFERTAFYNECVRPLNGFHAVFVREQRAGHGLLLAVCRPPRRGDFSSTEGAVLRMLLPGLATALDLQRRLSAAECRTAALASVLDRLETAVVLTDAAARPLFVNARAAALAAEGDGFAVDDGGVFGATAAASQAIREAIAAVAAGGGREGRRLRLERGSRRPPLAATVLPVAHLDLAIAGVPAPQCALFISETEAARPIDPQALSDFHRLTRRESEIAALLAGGIDLKSVAERLQELGITTVRSHLRRIFDKTDTHSQAALVALIRTTTGPLG